MQSYQARSIQQTSLNVSGIAPRDKATRIFGNPRVVPESDDMQLDALCLTKFSNRYVPQDEYVNAPYERVQYHEAFPARQNYDDHRYTKSIGQSITATGSAVTRNAVKVVKEERSAVDAPAVDTEYGSLTEAFNASLSHIELS